MVLAPQLRACRLLGWTSIRIHAHVHLTARNYQHIPSHHTSQHGSRARAWMTGGSSYLSSIYKEVNLRARQSVALNEETDKQDGTCRYV